MFKKPKGTTDWFPEDQAVRSYVFGILRDVAERYHFQEIESPGFEEQSTLSHKEGEEIKEQIFTLEQRGKEALGLRFDMTIPSVRMFLSKQKELPKPVQWYYLTRMWRYERPQKGRLREFYQFGVECFGSDDALADVQIIEMAIESLKALGLTHKDFFVRLNNRKLLYGIMRELVESEHIDDLVAVIDKREKISEKEFFRMLKDLHVKDPGRIVELLNLTDLASLEQLELNKEAREGLAELKAVYALLDEDYVRISLDTVRGLAYYTGTVFEIFDTGGKYRSLCGGGRYDDLVGHFGGQDTPATGFGMGYSILALLLQEKGLLPETKSGPEYYVAPVTEDVLEDAHRIARALRAKHNVELGLKPRSLGKQMSYASSIHAHSVVIVGPRDLTKKQVTIRELQSGDEYKLAFTKLDTV